MSGKNRTPIFMKRIWETLYLHIHWNLHQDIWKVLTGKNLKEDKNLKENLKEDKVLKENLKNGEVLKENLNLKEVLKENLNLKENLKCDFF